MTTAMHPRVLDTLKTMARQEAAADLIRIADAARLAGSMPFEPLLVWDVVLACILAGLTSRKWAELGLDISPVDDDGEVVALFRLRDAVSGLFGMRETILDAGLTSLYDPDSMDAALYDLHGCACSFYRSEQERRINNG